MTYGIAIRCIFYFFYCREVFEPIIKSNWCLIAFDPFYCPNTRQNDHPTPCRAFKEIIRFCPKLACSVMDNCISSAPDDPGKEIHDFRIFEYIYYSKCEYFRT